MLNESQSVVRGKWDIIEVEFKNGILKIEPQQDMNYELEDLLSFHDYALELTNHQDILILSDYRHHHLRVSSDSMKHSARDPELNKTRIAEAVLVKSLPNMLLARFYIRILKPICPTRVFKNKEQALNWLDLRKEIYEANKKQQLEK